MIPTPIFYENTSAGTKQWDVFSKLLSNRIIMLFDQIDDHTACAVISQLLFLEAMDPEKDIRIYINSPGGSVKAGLAIYDTMKHIKCDVATYCVGEASSMGAFLLAAGARGKRYSLENSSIMIHQPMSAISYGQTKDIMIHAQLISETKTRLDRIFASLTGKTEKQISEDTDRDYFMTSLQAREYGIIDEVITDE